MSFKVQERRWYPFTDEENKITATLVELPDDSVKELEEFGRLNLDAEPNQEVTAVIIPNLKNFTRIPRNLLDFFPNMTNLFFSECKIKNLHRDDLKSYKNLKQIRFVGTDIEEFSEEIFSDLENLEIVIISKNKIKFIDKEIFQGLERLKYVELKENVSIDVIYAIKTVKIKSSSVRLYHIEDLNKIIAQIFSTRAIYEMQRVLESNHFKDFVIKVGGEEFKVHKLMLAARSPTLAEMIKNNPDADELILEDIEVEVFKIILDYIYNDVVPLDFDENLMKVFISASKLELNFLKRKTAKILCDAINPENALQMFQIASAHEQENLKSKAFDEIKKSFPIENVKNDLKDEPEALMKFIEDKKKYDEIVKKAKEALEKMKVDYEKFLNKK